MENQKLNQTIVDILENKKALNIESIDVHEKTTLGDYFILASANSTTHVKALADEVEFMVKKDLGILPNHIEGRETARWILLDYGDVIVHIFHQEEREFYSLDQLWLLARPKDIDSEA